MHSEMKNNSCNVQPTNRIRLHLETQIVENNMNRFAKMIIAATTLAATPAFAGDYSAKPATTPVTARIIARDISWACGTAACQGNTAESRPAVLCQGLAKRAGRLDSFIADGRAFSAAELAKCNLSAKDVAKGAAALANAN